MRIINSKNLKNPIIRSYINSIYGADGKKYIQSFEKISSDDEFLKYVKDLNLPFMIDDPQYKNYKNFIS